MCGLFTTTDRNDADDNNDNNVDRSHSLTLDFDLMLQRKREVNRRYRRKTGIDVINDNDAIAKMIADMHQAARDDTTRITKGIWQSGHRVGSFLKPSLLIILQTVQGSKKIHPRGRSQIPLCFFKKGFQILPEKLKKLISPYLLSVQKCHPHSSDHNCKRLV